MVVILGTLGDPCVSMTWSRLRHDGSDVLLIEDDQFLATTGLTWSVGDRQDGFLHTDARAIPLTSLSSVLVRMHRVASADPDLTEPDQRYVWHEVRATVIAFLNTLACPVINRPEPRAINGPLFGRAHHVERVTQHGFALPSVHVTPSRARVRDLYERRRGTIILSSLSGLVPWRPVASAADLQAAMAATAHSPFVLQEVPAGEWLQVFTVGERVVGGSLGTEPSDADHAGRLLQPVDLSPRLQAQAARLARGLGLQFAQLYLVQPGRGPAYCVAVNPFPRFDGCPDGVQEGLATALAELLRGDEARAA